MKWYACKPRVTYVSGGYMNRARREGESFEEYRADLKKMELGTKMYLKGKYFYVPSDHRTRFGMEPYRK